MMLRLSLPLLFGLVLLVQQAEGSSLRISSDSDQRAENEVEADYGMSHLFVDETAGQRVPITVFFDPQRNDVAQAEVFTNLDRRDLATVRPHGAQVEEGISPPPGNGIAAGDEQHYYHALPMKAVAGGYQLILFASKTGAYRLTARYRLSSDPASTYRWYNDEQNAQGIRRRDYAIIVSPGKARDVQLYEANPLTITAAGTAPEQRGTFASMAGAHAACGPRFSFSYLHQLGINAIWLQPIHPRGIAGRKIDPATNQPYELGSPYSVKNYFAVSPLMASGFQPGSSPAGNDTPAGREQALSEFRNFVAAAAPQNIGIFLDAPFNHAAHDAELAAAGQRYWGNANSNQSTEIRSIEARVFSRAGEYDIRASGADNIAPAPDRSDFGKWIDVADIYFGRYAALVPKQSQQGRYTNEEDWFDYNIGDENATGVGHFDQITQRVWPNIGGGLTSPQPSQAAGIQDVHIHAPVIGRHQHSAVGHDRRTEFAVLETCLLPQQMQFRRPAAGGRRIEIRGVIGPHYAEHYVHIGIPVDRSASPHDSIRAPAGRQRHHSTRHSPHALRSIRHCGGRHLGAVSQQGRFPRRGQGERAQLRIFAPCKQERTVRRAIPINRRAVQMVRFHARRGFEIHVPDGRGVAIL
jgi:hypothetical protein